MTETPMTALVRVSRTKQLQHRRRVGEFQKILPA
jgi:hypothetical protein